MALASSMYQSKVINLMSAGVFDKIRRDYNIRSLKEQYDTAIDILAIINLDHFRSTDEIGIIYYTPLGDLIVDTAKLSYLEKCDSEHVARIYIDSFGPDKRYKLIEEAEDVISNQKICNCSYKDLIKFIIKYSSGREPELREFYESIKNKHECKVKSNGNYDLHDITEEIKTRLNNDNLKKPDYLEKKQLNERLNKYVSNDYADKSIENLYYTKSSSKPTIAMSIGSKLTESSKPMIMNISKDKQITLYSIKELTPEDIYRLDVKQIILIIDAAALFVTTDRENAIYSIKKNFVKQLIKESNVAVINACVDGNALKVMNNGMYGNYIASNIMLFGRIELKGEQDKYNSYLRNMMSKNII